MATRKTAWVVVALVFVGGLGCSVLADDPPPKPTPKAEAGKKADGQKVASKPANVPPTKTIKLEFKLAGDEERVFPVLCAIGEFSICHDIKEVEGEHSVRLGGELHHVDERGRALVSFKAALRHANLKEGAEANFSSSGSVLLEMGKEKKLARLGEATLKVTATVEE